MAGAALCGGVARTLRLRDAGARMGWAPGQRRGGRAWCAAEWRAAQRCPARWRRQAAGRLLASSRAAARVRLRARARARDGGRRIGAEAEG